MANTRSLFPAFKTRGNVAAAVLGGGDPKRDVTVDFQAPWCRHVFCLGVAMYSFVGQEQPAAPRLAKAAQQSSQETPQSVGHEDIFFLRRAWLESG